MELSSIFPQGLVVLDLETTGLSPLVHEIIEIGAVKINANGQCQFFESFVRPEKKIEYENFLIHGINNQMVEKARPISAVLKEFFDFIQGYPLLGHNLTVDIGFLTMDAIKNHLQLPASSLLDSCSLARYVLNRSEQLENYKLSSLCQYFSIDLPFHRAVADSLASFYVTAEVLNLMSADEVENTLNTKAYLFQWDQLSQESIKINQISPILQSALLSGDVIKISYDGGSQGREPRPIRPISIIPMPTGLVLYAECLMSGLNKSFKIKKILNFQEN